MILLKDALPENGRIVWGFVKKGNKTVAVLLQRNMCVWFGLSDESSWYDNEVIGWSELV